jgi:hypothetical protein
MRRLLSSLFCLTLLLAPTRARALSTTTMFGAFVNGASQGTVRFTLDSVIPGVACRYIATWQSKNGLSTAECALEQDTWVGHQSCVENALGPFDGIVENVGSQGCAGFDGNNQNTHVFLLMLGGGGGKLDGVIQYSAASSIPSAFEAIADP